MPLVGSAGTSASESWPAGKHLHYQKGDRDGAIKTLEALLARHPEHRDAEMLLGELTRKKSP